jgi:tRNA(His) 5'-end guanylyltransferase
MFPIILSKPADKRVVNALQKSTNWTQALVCKQSAVYMKSTIIYIISTCHLPYKHYDVKLKSRFMGFLSSDAMPGNRDFPEYWSQPAQMRPS